MSSSLILRSTVPRTFRAVSGRSALLKAVQGLSKVNNTFLISQPTNEQRDMLQPLQPTCPAAVSDQSFSLTTPKPSISYIAVYKGTVNDPTDFPPPSKSHGSYHWAFERLLSAGLVPLTAAAFVTSGSQYPVLDGLLGISLVMHSHIGVRLFSFLKSYHRDRGAMF